VVFLTRDHGVVRGVAKGIKRLKSRYGSSFEPFNSVNLTYFQKEDRDLVSIQEAEITRSNFVAASEPTVFTTYSYIAEMLLAFTPPNDPSDILFRMVRACFETNDLTPENMPAIRTYFEVWLLRLGGFLPDWSKCFICSREFSQEDLPSIDNGQHLICDLCNKGHLHNKVPLGWFETIQNARRLSPTEFASDENILEPAVAISAILRRIIERVLDRPITSMGSTAI
jgi:DNA repair protein RecO (recombination protein O)